VGAIGEMIQHFRSFAATQDGRLLVAGGRYVAFSVDSIIEILNDLIQITLIH